MVTQTSASGQSGSSTGSEGVEPTSAPPRRRRGIAPPTTREQNRPQSGPFSARPNAGQRPDAAGNTAFTQSGNSKAAKKGKVVFAQANSALSATVSARGADRSKAEDAARLDETERLKAVFKEMKKHLKDLERAEKEVKKTEYRLGYDTLIQLGKLGISKGIQNYGYFDRKIVLEEIDRKCVEQEKEIEKLDKELHVLQGKNARAEQKLKVSGKKAPKAAARDKASQEPANILAQISGQRRHISLKQKKIDALESFITSVITARSASMKELFSNQLAALTFDGKSKPERPLSTRELLNAAQNRQLEFAREIENHVRTVESLSDRLPSDPSRADNANIGTSASARAFVESSLRHTADSNEGRGEEERFDRDTREALLASKAEAKALAQQDADEDEQIRAAMAASLREAEQANVGRRAANANTSESDPPRIIELDDGTLYNPHTDEVINPDNPGKPAAK